MYNIKLTYFKSTGKYYTNAKYPTNKEEMYEIVDEVKEMREKGKLPAITGKNWIVHIDSDEHPKAYPCLLLLSNIREGIKMNKRERFEELQVLLKKTETLSVFLKDNSEDKTFVLHTEELSRYESDEMITKKEMRPSFRSKLQLLLDEEIIHIKNELELLEKEWS